MRQSTKFLFVLFALCSLFGAFFIGGCSDETNVTEADAESKVIGSIEGIVTDATNNNPVAGVTVTVVIPNAAATNPKAEAETQAAEETVTATTDANGYYLIENRLGSGEYSIIYTAAGYFSSRDEAYIPTLEEIVQNDSPPKGDVPYRDNEDEALWPMSSAVTVTGQLVAPAPSPELKDDPNVMAAGEAVANVQVTLDYETSDYYYDKDAQIGNCGFSFFPNVFTTTTDANGNFTFTGVPATGCVVLRVAPYKVGQVQYSGLYSLQDLWAAASNGTADLGSFVSSIAGSQPIVTAYNFGQGSWPVAVDANLVLTFSMPMDNIDVEVRSFSPNAFEQFVGSWDATKTIYTINPTLALRPAQPTSQAANYEVEINSGQAQNGRSLSFWDEDFRTAPGIAFMGTNLDDFGPVGDEFSNFPLDQPITLDFSMPPNLNNTGSFVLFDFDKKKSAAALPLDSVVVSGNTVSIWPNGVLESAAYYCVDFRMYSNLREDYADDNELTGSSLCFQARNTDETPGNVANFVLDEDASDYPADWNSTDFTFLWDRVPGARWYDLYAKDNSASLAKGKLSDGGTLAAGNPEYLLIATVNDQDFLTRQTVSISGNGVPGGAVDHLGDAGFDLYDDDGIYTPFSGGLEVTFAVKARNAAGSSVGFSNAITVADEVAPAFTVTMVGDADNSDGFLLEGFPGDADTTFEIHIDPYSPPTKAPAPLEYLMFTSNPVFTVEEAGGDDNYRIQESQITWEWANDVRDGFGTVVVPVGFVGSGDRLIVDLSDNSGNVATDSMFFGPVIEFFSPTSADTTWEAPGACADFDVDFTDVTAGATGYDDTNEVRVYLSFDGGATWVDTLTGYDFDDGDDGDEVCWSFDDTLMVDGTAKIGVQRYDAGVDTAFGAIWGSDEFTINGIMVTSPDSAWVANNPWVFDAGGTDSTAIDIQWTSVGLSEVVIWYDGGFGLTPTDTVMATDGQIMWYPPDLGQDYTVTITVADNDSNNRPWGNAPMTVDVIHDEVTITHPSAFEVAPQGADFSLGFNIEWFNLVASADTLPSILTIDYGYADGYSWSNPTQMDSVFTTDITWTNIFTDIPNDGIELWAAGNIPQTAPSDSVVIRVWALDDAGLPAIQDYSSLFTIAGMKLSDPNGGEEIESGTSYGVNWDNYGGFNDNYTLEYSVDGGANYLPVMNGGSPMTDQVNGGGVNWDLPANTAATGVLLRIKSTAIPTVLDIVDSAFSITGFNITYPGTNYVYYVGTLDSVKWSSVGSFTGVDIEFWTDDGNNPPMMTPVVVNHPNTSPIFSFAPQQSWSDDPVTPGTQFDAWIIIRSNGGTAQDSLAVKFSVPSVSVTAPNGGEAGWQIGTTQNITWTSTGFSSLDSVRIELSTDGGGTYPTTIVEVPYTPGSYAWTIPAGTVANNNAMVRITQMVANVGDGVTDESDAVFTIVP